MGTIMDADKLEALWNHVTEQVKQYENIDTTQVNAFFSRLEPQAFSEGFLMLTADNSFIQKWIEEKFLAVIKRALRDIYMVPFEVIIEVDESQDTATPGPGTTKTEQPSPSTKPSVPVPVEPISPAPATQNDPVSPVVKPKGMSALTFDNFIIGNSNRMAYSMALAVAENPGSNTMNPLFVYGKSGLGKTHLLRAIQNYVMDSYPQMKTIYVDTMDLVNDYSDAAWKGGSGNFNDFKHKYESADVLMVDDVQGLQGKKETLNLMFQIFNRMLENGKQIVLSADRSPNNIDIDERYKSRFSQGGTFDIQAPEYETKLGIVRSSVVSCKESLGHPELEIPKEIEIFIAENSSSNIRELKGCVASLVAQVINENMVLGEDQIANRTIDDYKRMASKNLSGGSMRKITVSEIQKAVEEYYGITHAELVGKGRVASITHARQMAIYLCSTMIDITQAAIGAEFNREHATVIYSIKSVKEKMKDDREINEQLEYLRQVITE